MYTDSQAPLPGDPNPSKGLGRGSRVCALKAPEDCYDQASLGSTGNTESVPNSPLNSPTIFHHSRECLTLLRSCYEYSAVQGNKRRYKMLSLA